MTVPEGAELNVQALFSHDDGDIDLTLYDENEFSVDSSTSITDNEELEAAPTETQTFYIEVYGWAGATNDYELDVSIDGPEYEVQGADGSSLTDGEPMEVQATVTNVGSDGDEEVVRLVVEGVVVDEATVAADADDVETVTLEWDEADEDVDPEDIEVVTSTDSATVSFGDGLPIGPVVPIVALLATLAVLHRRR